MYVTDEKRQCKAAQVVSCFSLPAFACLSHCAQSVSVLSSHCCCFCWLWPYNAHALHSRIRIRIGKVVDLHIWHAQAQSHSPLLTNTCSSPFRWPQPRYLLLHSVIAQIGWKAQLKSVKVGGSRRGRHLRLYIYRFLCGSAVQSCEIT